ncbi:hypothetical protein ABZY09_01605 [Streptomyces sp. NPDC002928]|uniref:hypothetical protein n=1 Tax=Streptomyces sp. NPDC002928 TaxID=3154440 RepID=UPI0033A82DE3
MSLRSASTGDVSEETARAAVPAFLKGTLAIRIRDKLGVLVGMDPLPWETSTPTRPSTRGELPPPV